MLAVHSNFIVWINIDPSSISSFYVNSHQEVLLLVISGSNMVVFVFPGVASFIAVEFSIVT